MNNFFIINLKKREDRKEKIKNIFDSIYFKDYEFYEAIDGKKLKLNCEIKNLFKDNDFCNRKCIIGCALSHYNIWLNLLKDKKNDYYIILEDDISLSPYFLENLNKCEIFLKNNIKKVDFLFLNYFTFNSNNEIITNEYLSQNLSFQNFQKDIFIGGTFSYIISKNGAEKMIKYIEDNGIKHGIDYLIKINDSLNIYEIEPKIVFSKWVTNINDNVDSDIQKDFEIFDFNNYYDYNNYLFYKKLDIINYDYDRLSINNINTLINISNNNPNIEGFNTLGYLKKKIDLDKLIVSNFFHDNDGIFIKLDKTIRVKIISDYASSYELCKSFNNLSKGNNTWNNIRLVEDDNNIDYYVIINRSINNEYYNQSKTILFQMEPYCNNEYQNWGIKTWGEWSNPDPNIFLEVRNNKNTYNNCTWLLKETYSELSGMNIVKSKNYLSTICSSKYYDPGHIQRIDFLKYIENQEKSFKIDIYGNENKHNLKNYISSLSSEDKSNGILPYKYYFMVENNYELNYITEKFWEAIVCESLIFYCGAPNISNYINKMAYVSIDLNNFEESYHIIKNAIENDLWSKRINFIREEKYKVLNYYNFFPTIERTITKDLWKNNINILNYDFKIYIYSNKNIINKKIYTFIKIMEEFNFEIEIYNNENNKNINSVYNFYEHIIKKSNNNNFLILDDNIELITSLNNLFNHMSILPENYDCSSLYISDIFPVKITEQINSLYYNVKKFYFETEIAYFISKNGINKILNYINDNYNIIFEKKSVIYECYENIDNFNFYTNNLLLFKK